MTKDQLGVHYRTYIECLNQRRIDEAQAFYAADLLYNGREISSAEWRKSAIEDCFEAFPNLQWHVERLVIDGDCLAAQLSDSATFVQPWQGIPPTGKVVVFGENAFYRFEAGLIVEVRSIVDVLALQR